MEFIRRNLRFLGFGVLLCAFSSYGQTFLISFFNPFIREELVLTHGEFGLIYSIGTLASAALLPWSGKWVDRVAVGSYTAVSCAGLAIACLMMSLAYTPVVLVAAVFLVRQFGQGLMYHTASTTVARYFTVNRGKGMGVLSMGFPLGEAILPAVTVVLIAWVGWRGTFGLFALSMFGVLPLALWLLAGRHGDRETDDGTGPGAGVGAPRELDRREVMRDPVFYVILSSTLAPAFIITGLFFHHAHIAEQKGWQLEWIALWFPAYAALSIAGSLVAGWLIDRHSAHWLLFRYLAPLIGALALLWLANGDWVIAPYLGLLGINVGLARSMASALWAERYGVTHLGAIRSMTVAFAVFSTAVSPILFGWLFDAGVRPGSVAAGCAAWCLAATAAVVMMVRPRAG